ncbi:hypothetical protein [Sphingomonas phyllosphaerae]|uniref:hypothetical protein n=1 Tax=Sphingomonas phyllosphaerae TaxID=257003 RepID=UPI002FFA3CB2
MKAGSCSEWINCGIALWERSVALNWTVIPLFTGLVVSCFTISEWAGVGEAALHAQARTIKGHLHTSGKRDRYLRLVLPSGERVNVTCGAYYNAGSCVLPSVLPEVRSVDVFDFAGTNVILAARDGSGKVLLSPAQRMDQLRGLAENARSDKWLGKFVLGVLLGLIVATGRHLFFIRRRLRGWTG